MICTTPYYAVSSISALHVSSLPSVAALLVAVKNSFNSCDMASQPVTSSVDFTRVNYEQERYAR